MCACVCACVCGLAHLVCLQERKNILTNVKECGEGKLIWRVFVLRQWVIGTYSGSGYPYHAVPTAGTFDELDALRHTNCPRTIHPSNCKAYYIRRNTTTSLDLTSKQVLKTALTCVSRTDSRNICASSPLQPPGQNPQLTKACRMGKRPQKNSNFFPHKQKNSCRNETEIVN